MKAEEWDLETQFQTALAQFDDVPNVKQALIDFYRAFSALLFALIRADTRRRRGRRQ
jgi:hypothetical protein